MAIKEQDKVFYEELANGDKVINLPITRANNVEGIGRSANTAYVVGDVVYVDNNKKVALKCTQAGTTSNTELDVSGKAVGDTITDGSVVWQVCNRTSDVTSVNGKTGDVVIPEPNYPVTSVNGKTGDVDLPIPSDMNDYIVESYRNGSQWYEIYKSGKVRQGGVVTSFTTVTLLKPFTDTNYSLLVTPVLVASSENNLWPLKVKTATTITISDYKVSSNEFRYYYSSITWVAEGQGA